MVTDSKVSLIISGSSLLIITTSFVINMVDRVRERKRKGRHRR